MRKREPINPYMRALVLERDGYRCRFCGSAEGLFHLDHVYPVSKGGETTVENLVTACRRCNGKKSNKVGIWPNDLDYENKVQEEASSRFPIIGLSLAALGYLVILTGELWSTYWPAIYPGSLWIGFCVGFAGINLIIRGK